MVTDPLLRAINNAGGNPKTDESLKGGSTVLGISETFLNLETAASSSVHSSKIFRKYLFLIKESRICIASLLWTVLSYFSACELLPGSLKKQEVRSFVSGKSYNACFFKSLFH